LAVKVNAEVGVVWQLVVEVPESFCENATVPLASFGFVNRSPASAL
jgi:hypothetical protein